MATNKPGKPKLSAEQSAAADQRWTELEAQLDQEWPLHHESRLQTARILYQMKRWLRQWGRNKGRRGRWETVLRKHRIALSTANDYVRLWQEHEDMPPKDCVLARMKVAKAQEYSENNPADSAGLTPRGSCIAKVEAADDDDADKSVDRRIGVECVFVLTMAEKHKFMDAVKALGPLQATQEMYTAVIAAAPKVSGVGA